MFSWAVSHSISNNVQVHIAEPLTSPSPVYIQNGTILLRIKKEEAGEKIKLFEVLSPSHGKEIGEQRKKEIKYHCFDWQWFTTKKTDKKLCEKTDIQPRTCK